MNKEDYNLFTFPFDEKDIENLQYAMEVLVERHETDEWEAVGDKEENSAQYGEIVYLLAGLLGENVPCSQVDPLLYERYKEWCKDNRHQFDECITRKQVLVKFRNFN